MPIGLSFSYLKGSIEWILSLYDDPELNLYLLLEARIQLYWAAEIFAELIAGMAGDDVVDTYALLGKDMLDAAHYLLADVSNELSNGLRVV